jgi:hypothetical protein
MAITLHCEHCGKKVEAQDDAGGNWGKCPSCHNRIYIPDLGSGEELKLAPIDEQDRAKQHQLMSETHKLEQDILLERAEPDEDSDVSMPTSDMNISMPTSDMDEKQLTKNIITYLRQMTAGDLAAAEVTADMIVPYGNEAVAILDTIALSEIPEPELADIPQQVLAGLIRQLRTRIC